MIGLAQPAHAAPAESPAAKVARLNRQAANVRADMDRMNQQVEGIVERYNANHEALKHTQAAQALTQRRIAQAERDLAAALEQLGQRAWAIYTDGSPAVALSELLGATSLHDALTTKKFQEAVIAADQAAVAKVESARRGLQTLADQLVGQRRGQEALQTRLDKQRKEINNRLAEQRAYLAGLTVAVQRAVQQLRQRQEELRRQAIARRLAALRDGAGRSRAAGSGSAPSRTAARAVAFALRQLGKPYQWGATGPNSFDCSGLTQAAYRSAGLGIPRVSRDQWNAGPHVSFGNLRRGDLLFFGYNPRDPSTIHHVTMYIGNGLMVEAPFTGADVRISTIGRSDYVGAVRPTG